MNEQEKNSLSMKAWQTFGSKQYFMVVEECAELIQATSKLFRKGPQELILDNVAEEIADVEIMIRQLKVAHPSLVDRVEEWEEQKLTRLSELLEG